MNLNSREDVAAVFDAATRIFDERNAMYKDSWRKDGTAQNMALALNKVKRAMRLLDDQTLSYDAAFDDILDAINYLAFGLICAEDEAQHAS